MVFTRNQLKEQGSKINESTEVILAPTTNGENATVPIVSVATEKVPKDVRLMRVKVQKMIAKTIVNDLNEKRMNKKTCYGVVRDAFEQNKKIYTWLNYTQLHWHVKKMKEESKQKIVQNQDTVSLNASNSNSEATSQSTSILTSQSNSASSSQSRSSSTYQWSSEASSEINSEAPSKGGRPKGTSINDIKAKISNEKRCLDNICLEVMKKRSELKVGKRLSSRCIENIIDTNKKEFNVPENFKVHRQTIYSRLRRNNPVCEHRGPNSPMLDVEEVIVAIASQKAQMNQPITPKEGLELANSLIAGTPVEKEIRKFHRYKKMFEVDDVESPSLLKRGYWRGFMRRNNHRIYAQKGTKFSSIRSQWINWNNFKTMYDLVYAAMTKAGVAFKNKDDEYIMKHPEYVLFVDEVGNNTCMKDDGHFGGTKYLGVVKGEDLKLASSGERYCC